MRSAPLVRRAIRELVDGYSILRFAGALYSMPVRVAARGFLPPMPVDGPRELRLVSAISGEPIPMD